MKVHCPQCSEKIIGSGKEVNSYFPKLTPFLSTENSVLHQHQTFMKAPAMQKKHWTAGGTM
jgi:hypothetical protein